MNLSCAVVIPVKDEAASIGALIDETRTVCEEIPGLGYEIVVVDDGSTDGTWDVLTEKAKVTPFLKRVRHRYNAGQSAAVVSGVEAATSPWIFTLDGDGQNPPQDLIAFLDKLVACKNKKPHTIFFIGNRAQRNDSWVRTASTWVANVVRNAILNDGCLDSGCATKLFAREAFLRLPRFDHMHRFLGCLFKYQGADVVNIPVRHRPRKAGASKYTLNNRLWVGIRDLFAVRWLLARRRVWSNPELTDPYE